MRFRLRPALGAAVLTPFGGLAMTAVAHASPAARWGGKTANGNYVAVRGAIRAGASRDVASTAATAAQWAFTANRVGLLLIPVTAAHPWLRRLRRDRRG